MNTIKIKEWKDIPEDFTGIAEYPDGTKFWFKDGSLHREGGPAKEYSDGHKEWCKDGLWHREDGPAIKYNGGTEYWYLEGEAYQRIFLENYVILDHYKGKFGIMWYNLLDKDEILEHPDIPGLIIKK